MYLCKRTSKLRQMKKMIVGGLLSLLITIAYSQEKHENMQKIPAVEIKTMDGNTFNTKDISNNNKPMIISFWATWCKPCIAELLAIADVYDDWVEETGVKLYAVSIDDAKTAARVAPFVNGKGWDYTVLLDQNWDFKRAMSVGDVPFLFLLNGQGEVVWKHTSYAPGGENEIYEKLKKITEENK
jgi:thiol-disulfide isomerase/thioredoxin